MIQIRCRGIIVDNDELLVVKHRGNKDFVALPGGKLEHGETPWECMERELGEELGIKPQIERLLYIHNYMDIDNVQSVEFFFKIKNAADYRHINPDNCSHYDELECIEWIGKDSKAKLLPSGLMPDFIDNNFDFTETRFLG